MESIISLSTVRKMTPANKELEEIMRAESIYFQEIVQDKNRTMAV